MMKFFFLIILSALTFLYSSAQPSGKPVLISSRFMDGARFYIKMQTVAGDTILGYCDTGGGFTAVYPSVIKKLSLDSQVKKVKLGNDEIGYVLFKDIIRDPAIPPVSVAGYMCRLFSAPSFFVPTPQMMAGDVGALLKFTPMDAFLGQFFFLGKSWTFDYPHRQIWVNTPLLRDKQNAAPVQAIGLKKDGEGHSMFGHPRTQMAVDGDTIEVLFDTGASIRLTENGKKGLGTAVNEVAGSFISRTIFDKWRTKHPDWKIIEGGDITDRGDLIQVPKVTLGTVTVGPVWFSKRPDEAWSRGMIGSMDKVVSGAIGGSALQYLKVIIDYNNELISFQKN